MDHDDNIRTRAHQLWEEEGQPDGRHEDHWKRAKEELDVPVESDEAGGMLGGQARETTPDVNAGSVAGQTGAPPPKSKT